MPAATTNPEPASEPSVPPADGASGAAGPGQPHRGATAAFVVVVALGVALRFVTTSPLWLDEALTVNIARLPLGEMFEALRRDGSPPIYYVVLRGWTELFGEGDVAVRSLSGVFAVAALPFAWTAGRQLGGRRVAAAAVVLLATSPFAIRYATEARMYSLVILLVLVGYVLVRRGLLAARPSWWVLAGVATTSGLLALTHYWSFYLLAVVAGLLLARWRRRRDTGAARLVVAMAGGAVLFLPWLSAFVYQLGNTGTPWGTPAGPVDAVITTLTDFGGGRPAEGRVLAMLLGLMAVVALTGRPSGPLRIELDLRTRPGVRPEAVVAACTLAVAIVASWLAGSAFASRYTAALFPPALLTVAWGTRQLGDRRVGLAVLVVASLLGLAGGARNAVTDRTQAAEVATYIESRAAPDDVVVYCPDQLGPAVDRLLDSDPRQLRQMTFPTGGSPAIVDWSNYETRNRAADPAEFAEEVLDVAGRDATVWLVWIPGYRTFGEKCEDLSVALGSARPGSEIVILHDEDLFERHNLTRLPPP